jgi:hypothetical protein
MAADFSKVAGAGRIYVNLSVTLEKALANWLVTLKSRRSFSNNFRKCAGQFASDFRKVGCQLACAFLTSETNCKLASTNQKKT